MTMISPVDNTTPYLGRPRQLPNMKIPEGTGVVDIRIINTTAYQKVKTESLLGRPILGHNTLNLPNYAFLVTNVNDGTNVLFDLGMRKDWRNACPPSLLKYVSDDGNDAPLQVSVEKDVRDILDDDSGRLGIGGTDITAVIWSHHHFDHRGDISKFASHTKLIVGPGTRHTYLHSEIPEAEFRGRDIIELNDRDFGLTIGGFPAHDAFGDGSFYLLHSPGHTSNHLSALARVSNSPSNTFIFLGGDCAYHCGEFRPSPYMPLPKQIVFKPATWAFNSERRAAAPVLRTRKIMLCAGEFVQENLHPKTSTMDPFYETPLEPAVSCHAEANESLAKLELFDACDDVLVCMSHDPSLMNILPFYPYSLNDWYQKGYKQKVHWEFLYDFNLDEKPFPPPGQQSDGEKTP